MPRQIDRVEGRAAFGLDPAGYHAARPAYPDWVFDILRDRCGVGGDSAVFEIGPGSGAATRRLLDLGVRSLVAVEPDPRLADYLRSRNPDAALEVIVARFEDAILPQAAFDLGLSATAFHWLDEGPALAKVASLLQPGGWWAALWNVFGDSSLPDPFHEATKDLLAGPSSPSQPPGAPPFALDRKARGAAIERTGQFEAFEAYARPWSLVLDADQTVALYATYSNINLRPDRAEVLTALRRIARDDFGDQVTRNMITSLYIARRKA